MKLFGLRRRWQQLLLRRANCISPMAVFFFLQLAGAVAHAWWIPEAERNYYSPPAYMIGGLYAESPMAVCNLSAQHGNWSRSVPVTPYIIDTDPTDGEWRCQGRYPDGSDYFGYPRYPEQIIPKCQVNPVYVPGPFGYMVAPPGSSSPESWYYDSPKCWCRKPSTFDPASQWCREQPTCLTYPANKDTGCGKTVAELYAVKKVSTDPTQVFHQTQTCIAHKACDQRCKMENCDWMKKVIPDFVQPYLDKVGDWKMIEEICRADSGPIHNRLCAAAMADLHIKQDLISALKKSGCGSNADWDKAFTIIGQCTPATFGGSFEGTLARWPVFLFREKARKACTDYRLAQGLDPAINGELKGKTCTP